MWRLAIAFGLEHSAHDKVLLAVSTAFTPRSAKERTVEPSDLEFDECDQVV